VYPVRLLRAVEPRSGGFVFETEMLVRAAAAGWPLVETPVRAVHFAERRSRFRPARDGIAVGAYLTARGARRWAEDLEMVGGALLRPFTPERLRTRHRELHALAAPFRGNPAAYMTAFGTLALQRTIDTWAGWWEDPRAHRLRLVGAASLATPVLLALLALRRPLGRMGVDPLTPFIRHLYSQERLAATLGAPSRVEAIR
jgi:hypothetical protein